MRRYIAFAVVVLAVSGVAFAPTVSGHTWNDVEYSVYDSGSEFSNAQTLDNMVVEGGTVTLGGGGQTNVEDFEGSDPLADWRVIGDNPDILTTISSSYGTGTSMLWRPSTGGFQNRMMHTQFNSPGRWGTMKLNGLMRIKPYDDSNNRRGGFVIGNYDTNKRYVLMATNPEGSTGDYQIAYIDGNNNVEWLTGTFGDYDVGYSVEQSLSYNPETDTLKAVIKGYDTWTRTINTNRVLYPNAYGVIGTGSGGSQGAAYEYDNLAMTSPSPSSATYMSDYRSIDNPSHVSVDVSQLYGGEVTVEAVDGNGNVLGSDTFYSTGTHEVSLDPSAQAGSQVATRVVATDTGISGDMRFTMDRDAISFANERPSGTADSPDGMTVHTSNPELQLSVSDDDFDTAQGDSLTVDWYVDGTKVNTDSGITSAQQLTYEASGLSDGDHTWHAEISDSYGATFPTDINSNPATFTVSHHEPSFSSASPTGGELLESAGASLGINITDNDFTGDGDSLTVEWYLDGSKVQTDNGVSPSSGDSVLATYDTADLQDGMHDWYVVATDSYGQTVQSATHSFEIDRGEPTVSNPSPSGTTYYETNTLSVDVTDPNFKDQGGTGTTTNVTFYVDGTAVGTKSVTSSGTVSLDHTFADGSHDWYAEAVNEYGGSNKSATQTLTVSHDDPALSNPAPSGTLHYEENQLSVDLADADFGRDGDTVDVVFTLNGETLGTETVSGGGTTVTMSTGALDDGDYTWQATASDDYGYTTTLPQQSFTVQHDAPSASSPSIDGVTNYESNTLSVAVNDDDFGRDGESVDVQFFVDGNPVGTKEVTSNGGTASVDVGPYEDGAHSWHVEMTDDYGYTATSATWSMDIQHDTPGASSPSVDGVTHYADNTLGVDVADADFGRDGDSVTAEFFVNGTSVGTDEVTSNGTVSTSSGDYDDGSYEWTVELTDDYGHVTTAGPYAMDVQHHAPSITGMQDPGSTNNEYSELSVDVSDEDFALDGDVVTVEWFVDGKQVDVTQVSSNGRTSIQTPALDDGQHSWHVEASDRHGYSASTSSQLFEVYNYGPQVDSSTMSPANGTVLESYEATFTVDVTDRDFDEPSGDTVAATLVVEGEEVATDDVTADGQANVTVIVGFGGEVDYHWKLEDSYGYTATSDTQTITSPGSLEVFSEQNADQYVTASGSEATFYFQQEGAEDIAETRNITDGTVDMGGLPTDEPFVVVLRADGHYNRRVFIESLYQSDDVYMLPDSAEVVQPTFELSDYTGDYPLEETVLKIEKSIDGNWSTVDGDYFGAQNEMASILEYNERHRLILINTETGQRRPLGSFFPKASGTVDLTVQPDSATVAQQDVPGVDFNPQVDNVGASNGTAIAVSLSPRKTDVTEYDVVASAGGTELHNATYAASEVANMTLNLNGHSGENLTVRASWDGGEGPGYVTREYSIGESYSDSTGLIGSVQGVLADMPGGAAGIVGALGSGLIVAFVAPSMGVGAVGTVAIIAVAGFALLGFLPVELLGIAMVAYVTTMLVRFRP